MMKINTNNLCIGEEIKNYKQMCILLETDEKKGKGRDLQVEDWKRYFDFNRSGHKYIITDIYDEPIEKINNRSKCGIMSRINKGKYSKEVFPLVKNFVANSDIEYISKGSILKKLKLKNANYDVAMKNNKNVAKYLSDKLNIEISEDDIRIILHSIYDNATNKIHNAFKNLEKLGYICSYTDRLLTVYENGKGQYIPSGEESYYLEVTILTEKATLLKDYFLLIGKEKYWNDMIEAIKEECNDDVISISNKLTSQLFFRGLLNGLKEISLKEINKIKGLELISNYYYSYGYIKNYDIEWDREILDMARENLHIDNYKDTVKNSFLSKSFVNDFKAKIYIKERNEYKRDRILEGHLSNHLESFKEKSDVLFDLFASDKPILVLNNKEIQKYCKDKISHQSV